MLSIYAGWFEYILIENGTDGIIRQVCDLYESCNLSDTGMFTMNALLAMSED